jgi:hypothetical protein
MVSSTRIELLLFYNINIYKLNLGTTRPTGFDF